jgi:hypothetical protein
MTKIIKENPDTINIEAKGNKTKGFHYQHP